MGGIVGFDEVKPWVHPGGTRPRRVGTSLRVGIESGGVGCEEGGEVRIRRKISKRRDVNRRKQHHTKKESVEMIRTQVELPNERGELAVTEEARKDCRRTTSEGESQTRRTGGKKVK